MQIRELLALVDRASLVTALGPPGVGKSWLARAAARERGGIVVALERAKSVADVLDALARALRVSVRSDGEPALRRAIADRLGGSALLVLDDADDALEALATLVAEPAFADESGPLGSLAPIVVTARAPLGVALEHRFPVAPLDETAALALFVARMNAVYGRALAADERPDAIAIVRELDGLPLAIELAVSRLDALDLASLHRGLGERRLKLLRSGFRNTPARHASLLAAFEDVLTPLAPRARALLLAATAFRADFSREALSAVAGLCPDDDDTHEAWAELHRASLVLEDEGRFRILRVVRDRVRAEADVAVIEGLELAHARWYAALAADHEPTSPHEAVRLLRVEEQELSAALDVAYARASELVSPLTRGLHPLRTSRGPRGAHLAMLERALEVARHAGDPAASAHLEIRLAEAWVHWDGPRHDASAVRQAGELLASMGDRVGHLRSLLVRARVAVWTTHDEAAALVHEAVALARAIGDDVLLARTLRTQARLWLTTRPADAEAALLEGLSLVPPGRADATRAEILATLGVVRLDVGDAPAAIGYSKAALAIHERDESVHDAMVVRGELSAALWQVGAIDEARALQDAAIEEARQSGAARFEGFFVGYAAMNELAQGDPTYALHALPLAIARTRACGDDKTGPLFEAFYAAALHASGAIERARGLAREILGVPLPAAHEHAIADLLAIVLGEDVATSPRQRAAMLEDRLVDRFRARRASPGRDAPESEPPRVGALRVASDGFFFVREDGERVELARRPVLRRVLSVLARRHAAGEPTSLADLIREGWPGEKILPAAAAHRAYMAVTTLKRLGLRDRLRSLGDGYALVGPVRVDAARSAGDESLAEASSGA